MEQQTITRPLQRRRWARAGGEAPATSAGRMPWATLLAGVLLAAWLLVAPRSPDLAAQVYRLRLFEHSGFVLWDDNWYAGHHIPGYSLVFPPLAALVGLRLAGALAVLLSARLFEALARTLFGAGTLPAELWFAAAAAGDAWIGRLTFALGVTFALAAALAAVGALRARERRRRRWLAWGAGLCGAFSAASSPVAGVLLAFAAGSWALAATLAERWEGAGGATPPRTAETADGEEPWGLHRPGRASGSATARLAWRLRVVAPLLLGPLVVVGALELLFPEGGFEPYAGGSLAAALAVTLAFMVALPRRERTLLIAGALYVLANLLSEIPTPMGSNVQRYAVLLAGPLLLCALYGRPAGERGRPRRFRAGAGSGGLAASSALWQPGAAAGAAAEAASAEPGSVGAGRAGAGRAGAEDPPRRGLGASRMPRALAVAALCGIAFWDVWGPVKQTTEVIGERSTQAAYYVPVERFLAAHGGGLLRIEVPFTRAHWEAALLAPHVELARGWERQLDKRYNESLESASLSAAEYRAWLRRNGVSYVALPDAPFDESSYAEVRLIRSGLPYLKEVLRTAHWRVFRVLDGTSLVEGRAGAGEHAGAARLSALGHDGFTLSVLRPGRLLVRLHYTPYWSVLSGTASLASGDGGFTVVQARRAGVVRVAARFSLAGAWGAVESAL